MDVSNSSAFPLAPTISYRPGCKWSGFVPPCLFPALQSSSRSNTFEIARVTVRHGAGDGASSHTPAERDRGAKVRLHMIDGGSFTKETWRKTWAYFEHTFWESLLEKLEGCWKTKWNSIIQHTKVESERRVCLRWRKGLQEAKELSPFGLFEIYP